MNNSRSREDKWKYSKANSRSREDRWKYSKANSTCSKLTDAWIVGLFEGDGLFQYNLRDYSATIQVSQSDHDRSLLEAIRDNLDYGYIKPAFPGKALQLAGKALQLAGKALQLAGKALQLAEDPLHLNMRETLSLRWTKHDYKINGNP